MSYSNEQIVGLTNAIFISIDIKEQIWLAMFRVSAEKIPLLARASMREGVALVSNQPQLFVLYVFIIVRTPQILQMSLANIMQLCPAEQK